MNTPNYQVRDDMKTRGVVLIAHNNRYDYYSMAVSVAERAAKFLNLPTTIITDQDTLDSTTAKDYKFDHTVVIEADKSNYLKNVTWINKGRYQVYDLSPYDETLVLDTDYMINSDSLLKTFDQPSDFVCYRTAKYFFDSNENEMLSLISLDTYWATVMRFSKTDRVKQIFQMIKMVQDNYQHYAEIHHFLPYTYRNDYALTIALRAVNGHIERPEDFIPGHLNHVEVPVVTERLSDTSYRLSKDVMYNGRTKKQYIDIKDFDFHMLDKQNYMRITE